MNNQEKYEELTKEELLNIINSIQDDKKLGLIWEDEDEEIEIEYKKHIPILRNIENLNVLTDDKEVNHSLIESDNLFALQSLQTIYRNKIDLIYIDPPYNTGASDWMYNNDYIDKNNDFRHSKWLSMMSRRLKLAKQLLSEIGFIAIAIDHNELFYLGVLCDEIFGERNRIGTITIQHHPRGRTQSKFFSTTNEFTLVYAKNIDNVEGNFYLNNTPEETTEDFIRAREDATPKTRPNLYYPIYFELEKDKISLEKPAKNFIEILPLTKNGMRTWKLVKDAFLEELEKENIYVEIKGDEYRVKRKIKRQKSKLTTNWTDSIYDANPHGNILLKNILGNNDFAFPKSIYAVKDFVQILTNKNSIVLDFFAGSGTTGHSVMELNKNDNGERKFILVTNNENEICRKITYPRIKNVMKGYKNKKNKFIEGLGGNLYFYDVDLVKSENSDSFNFKLSKILVSNICMKEDTLKLFHKEKDFLIYSNSDKKLTLIIFNEESIPLSIQHLPNDYDSLVFYIYSLEGETFEVELSNLKEKNIEVNSIPFPAYFNIKN